MTVSAAELFPRTCHLIEDGIRRRWHWGVQASISLKGQIVGDFAVGENAPGAPLTPDTLMLWRSAGKPITAVAVLQQVDAGRLDLQAPVAEVIPEFAQQGKEHVTTWHLLTHTGGLRPIVTGWPQRTWEEIIAKICENPLQRGAEPGRHAMYDPARSWFILAEILQRLTGRPITQLLREEILLPCGMEETWLSFTPEQYARDRDRLGILYDVKDGNLVATNSHELSVLSQPAPGGSMRGPIRELRQFYEMLMRGGTTASGKRLLSADMLSEMTRRQREGMLDVAFQHKVDFGLGVIINSNRYGAETIPYGFGRYASEESFGHGGAQSSIGFADPERSLVVAMVANGTPGDDLHNQRFRDLNSALYEDLDLA